MRKHNVSALSTCEGHESQFWEHHFNIVVGGIVNPRTKLRVSVLLNMISEYHVKYIVSEDEIANSIEESNLVIGTGITAHEGLLRCRPVIVVGDYGCGGLVTPDTFRNQCKNRFRGRINGMKDEYFPLDKLEGEIKRGFCLTFQELQMMSNQMTTFLHNVDF